MSTIIFVIVVILVIINLIGKALREVQKREGPEEPDEEVYEVPQEEVRRILRQLGKIPGQEERPQGTVPRPPQPGQARPGGVVPTAQRRQGTRSVQVGREQWPPAAPQHPQRPGTPPRPRQEEHETTRRVREDQRLQPTVESHLRERHLGEGERTLEPSIAQHVEDRRLAEDQQSLATSVDAHLTQVGLAEDAAMLASEGLTEVPTGVAAKHAVRPVGLHVVRRAAGESKTRIGPLDRNGLRQAVILSEILQPPMALRPSRFEESGHHGRAGANAARQA